MNNTAKENLLGFLTKKLDITWGGSGFERVVFEWIIENVPYGSVAVEIGAGFVSTKCLSACFDLYSIEHDERFMAEYPTKYILAPADNTYDWEIVKKNLPPKELQKFILIDGIDRRSILKNIDLFNKDAIYLVHDTNREIEIELAKDLAKLLGRGVTFHTDGDFWATI